MAAGKAGHVAGLVNKLLAYPNIPRKKNKFFNFVSNCMSIRKPEDVERVWTVIVEANQKNNRPEEGTIMGQQSNGTKRLIPVDEQVKGKPAADKKRIRKGVGGGENENGSTVQSDLPNRVVCEQSHFDDNDPAPAGDVSASCQDEKNDSACTGEPKFSWKKTIKRLVKEHEEQSLHLNDLKRQVSQSIDFSLCLPAYPPPACLRATSPDILLSSSFPRSLGVCSLQEFRVERVAHHEGRGISECSQVRVQK